MKKELGFSSRALHVGSEPDPSTGAIMPPIFQSSTYVQSSPGQHQGYEYSRTHNPTRSRLEACLSSLEEAQFAIATASGMSAALLVLHALAENSTVLCGDDVYGGTYRMLTTIFDKKLNPQFVDTTNLENLEKQIKKQRPGLIWLESPTNPLLKITDIKKVTSLGHQYGAKVLVDNTFMSPYFQKPLSLGADIVLHSMAKYINGHSDILGGCLILNDSSLYDQLWTLQNSIGPSLSPFDSWLVLRGIKTLALRMEAHERNALTLAKWLDQHPKVEKVIYPGLKSHPQYELAKKQMNGFGGMITVFIKANLQKSKEFLSHVELFSLAESLGGVESLIEHPALMTHASVPPEVRRQLGIDDNLIRLSVGVENVEDLQLDLQQALQRI